MAAKHGATVVAIEPFYDNIIRIHKASILENLTNSITLIRNALTDQRNQIKLLSNPLKNVAAQTLVENIHKQYKKSELSSNKYLVETILLDDIIEFLPLEKRKRFSKKAIMKIDIEGLEAFAILSGKRLFDILDIQVVIMEWEYCKRITNHHTKVEEMILFFINKNLVPHSIEGLKLNSNNWKNWPWDVYWIKNNMI